MILRPNRLHHLNETALLHAVAALWCTRAGRGSGDCRDGPRIMTSSPIVSARTW